jgi:dephospho-CoA kinase
MADRTSEAAERGAEVVVHDVPLLFENGLEAMYEAVILVYAPEAVQLERLMSGRGVQEGRAQAIIATQMPMEDKRRLARLVVDNSRSRDETRAQVKRLWDGELVRQPPGA